MPAVPRRVLDALTSWDHKLYTVAEMKARQKPGIFRKQFDLGKHLSPSCMTNLMSVAVRALEIQQSRRFCWPQLIPS